jgi:PQQ-dependent catabolism-associated CXXCW motif protein
MRRAALLAIVLAIAAGPLPAQAPVPEPGDYRTKDYRAPTPMTLRGARTVTTAQAHAVWKAGEAAFIDVLPHAPRPANLPPGTIWRERERLDIPGSVWLPDTGYGALAPATEDYFRGGLEQATGGNKDKLIVIYCQRDCWMSWNAGKRALTLGYRNVAWYPDGTEGWQEAELPMEKAVPIPGRPGE